MPDIGGAAVQAALALPPGIAAPEATMALPPIFRDPPTIHKGLSHYTFLSTHVRSQGHACANGLLHRLASQVSYIGFSA